MKMNNLGIIYKATSYINGKSYIGQTINGLSGRISGHKTESKCHIDNSAFHNAIRKYGIDSFDWSVIWEGNSTLLDEMEKDYILEFDTYKNGYNSTLGGQDGAFNTNPVRGIKHHNFDHSIHIFYHQYGRIEENVTAYYMWNKYGERRGFNAVATGKKRSIKGWVLNIQNLRPNYHLIHDDGSEFKKITRSAFCRYMKVSSRFPSDFFRGINKTYKGWIIISKTYPFTEINLKQ